jgi:hypothetical protein
MKTTFKAFNEAIEEMYYNDGKLLGYHITSKRNIKSIMRNGLVPHVPEDYDENGDMNGVYFFKTEQDARDALGQWFGDRIEEIEEETGRAYNEVCLEVDLTGLEYYLVDSVEYEWIYVSDIDEPEPISPDRILRVFPI